MADAVALDLIRRRGDTVAERFTIKESDGTVLNISGFTFTLTVNTESSPTGTTNQVFNSSGSIADGPNGIVDFPFTAGNADQTPGIYFYDIQMIDGSAAIRTIVKGKLTFKQDITK